MACAVIAAAQNNPATSQAIAMDRQFQAAVADYSSGQFAAAAALLEKLQPGASKSFELHELLGLVYAAESLTDKSIPQLEMAVRLKPASAAARTNLATSLAHAGRSAQAVEQFRRALALDPKDYEANHNLASFYLQAGRMEDAIPLLEQAQRSRSTAYDNSYDLALAYFLSDRRDDARRLTETTLHNQNTGELHTLLGKIDEKDGRFLEAENEFATAARMDPSEDNLFAWGSELLLHRTYDPAIEVFQQAAKRYPDSARLLIGLGMALYSQGRYEDSIHSLLTAADLDPTDPRCYLFLSKAYLSSPSQADEVIQRFRRYAELQPRNALAQYYYAISLWKGKRVDDPHVDYPAVEALLEKSVALDGSLADAHLQLGILYNDQRAYEKSLPEYQRALQIDPSLAAAHYRLGQYYVHAGEKDKAQKEFAIYQKLDAQHLAEVDKERAEVQQFVVSAKNVPGPKE